MLEFKKLDLLDPDILDVEPNGMSRVFKYSVLFNHEHDVKISAFNLYLFFLVKLLIFENVPSLVLYGQL